MKIFPSGKEKAASSELASIEANQCSDITSAGSALRRNGIFDLDHLPHLKWRSQRKLLVMHRRSASRLFLWVHTARMLRLLLIRLAKSFQRLSRRCRLLTWVGLGSTVLILMLALGRAVLKLKMILRIAAYAIMGRRGGRVAVLGFASNLLVKGSLE